MQTKKGFSQLWAGVALVAILIVIGVWYYGMNGVPKGEEGMMDDNTIMHEDTMAGGTMLADDAMAHGEFMAQGTILAGESAPLIDFNKKDYDAAIASGKKVFLYFYANWCPVCKAEQPILMDAFDDLTTDQIIGFRVNYNDNETDANEVALARQFGVAYQHTKVFVMGDTMLSKSPESWDAARYEREFMNVLK